MKNFHSAIELVRCVCVRVYFLISVWHDTRQHVYLWHFIEFFMFKKLLNRNREKNESNKIKFRIFHTKKLMLLKINMCA